MIFLMALFIFSAQFGYHQMSISSYKPLISKISWFSNISKVTFLWLNLITPHFSTSNFDLPPWDLFLCSNEENNIIIWHFVRDKCQVPNSDPHGSEYIISNLGFSFFDLFLMNYNEILCIFMKTWKVEDEESPGINFPLIKCTKAWIWISFLPKNMNWFFPKNEPTFVFLVQVIPIIN